VARHCDVSLSGAQYFNTVGDFDVLYIAAGAEDILMIYVNCLHILSQALKEHNARSL
jgi:hypothetical protein